MQTSPNRKLPALYVLDSIVKNVGTPYTVYLGRSLYSTFMQAYTLVDGNTRRQMESMLKTWKEPVPGSMEKRPVFPPDVVRPIDNALIKARTAALQHQRQPAVTGQRQTQTPPQANGQYAPPPQAQQQQYYRPPSQQPQTQQPYGYPGAPQPQQFPTPNQYGQSGINQEDLKRDVVMLISSAQAKFATDWSNQSIRGQLNSLLALQTHLNNQQLDQSTLSATKALLDNMKAALPPSTPQQGPRQTAQTPQWQPQAPAHQPYQKPQPPQPLQYPPPRSTPQPPNIPQGALNGLSALFANGQKPSTPQMRQSVPSLQGATHAQLNTVQQAAPQAPIGADLMAALSKAGLMGQGTQSPAPQPGPQPPPQQQQPPPNPAALLAGLQHLIPSSSSTPNLPPQNPVQPVKQSAADLKTFNSSLVHALYDAQPNQCSTCGRRFLANPEGRENKSRHLDWHFRTNQRIAEAHRGHRNWFPDELSWIKLSDYDASTAAAGSTDPNASGDEGNAAAAAKKKTKGPQDQYVRAPAGMTRNTCSICYEEMGSSHPEELQDWVFMNAAMYKGKIVHATCFAEMKGAAARDAGMRGGAVAERERSATPESSLGKRKAEGGLGQGLASRLKME